MYTNHAVFSDILFYIVSNFETVFTLDLLQFYADQHLVFLLYTTVPMYTLEWPDVRAKTCRNVAIVYYSLYKYRFDSRNFVLLGCFNSLPQQFGSAFLDFVPIQSNHIDFPLQNGGVLGENPNIIASSELPSKAGQGYNGGEIDSFWSYMVIVRLL